jgi:RimJ/RimL family protein N-acetyltransferase
MREVLKYALSDATKVTLRPARPEDAAAIIAAVRSSSQERSYVLMEIYGRSAEQQRQFLERLDRARNLFLVATVGEAVVGILALIDAPLCGEPASSLAVGVHLVREWRGRGIGSAMLRYGVRWAKEHGYRRIEADLFTTNKRSFRIFRKAGFREDSCKVRVQAGAQQIRESILTRTLR